MKNVVSAYIERWNLVLGVIFIAHHQLHAGRARARLRAPGADRLPRRAWRQGKAGARRADGGRAMTALALKDLCKAFGGLRVTRNVNLSVEPGERRLIIGPNGAGKTTLFNLITGDLAPELRLDPRLRPRHHAHREPAARPYRHRPHLSDHHAVRARHASCATSCSHCSGCRRCAGTRSSIWSGRSICASAREAALARVGLADIAERRWRETSYGERRRVEIAMALAQKPKLLLLDEPFAGLSATSGATCGSCWPRFRATSPSS